MAKETESIQIAERFRMEEARLRRLTMRLTVIPAAAGLCVILASIWTVHVSRRNVVDAKNEAAHYRTERDEAAASLKEVSRELQVTRGNLANARLAAEKIRHGINHYQRGEYDEAVKDYRDAIGIDPGNYVVYDWLGYAYYRNRQYLEAESSLRKSVEINPKYARGYYNLSLALWARSKREEAVSTISKALELDPALAASVREDGQFAPFHQSPSFRHLMQTFATSNP